MCLSQKDLFFYLDNIQGMQAEINRFPSYLRISLQRIHIFIIKTFEPLGILHAFFSIIVSSQQYV